MKTLVHTDFKENDFGVVCICY